MAYYSKREEEKEKILEAALRVVNRDSISGTRMRNIAKEAGVIQSNLHYYFHTKKELLLSLLKYIQKDFSGKRDIILQNSAPSLRSQIFGFFRQKQDLILTAPEYERVQIDFWSQGQVDGEVNYTFQESYRIWREHAKAILTLYAPELGSGKINLIAGIMLSMMIGASIQYLSDSSAFQLDAYFVECTDILMNYIETNTQEGNVTPK